MDKIVKTYGQELTSKGLDTDSKFLIVEGYATTYGNPDWVGDVIDPGAFSESLKIRDPVVLWQHNYREPIGTATFKEDQKGLYITAQLPKADSFVMGRVLPQLEAGTVKNWSIGFLSCADWRYQKNGNRHIKKGILDETSLVTRACNEEAEVIRVTKAVGAAKNLPLADPDRSWDSAAAIQRIREFTNSTDSPSADYKKAFFYYDAENPDNFTAYKLPFADVVNGELQAIPRALSAVVGVLNGARGGLTGVSEQDQASIKSLVSDYYKRLDRGDPFSSQKWITLERIKGFNSKKDFEELFNEAGFSKQASVAVASKLNLPAVSENTIEKSSDLNTEQLQQALCLLQELKRLKAR